VDYINIPFISITPQVFPAFILILILVKTRVSDFANQTV
jgi:hypothetical protein